MNIYCVTDSKTQNDDVITFCMLSVNANQVPAELFVEISKLILNMYLNI